MLPPQFKHVTDPMKRNIVTNLFICCDSLCSLASVKKHCSPMLGQNAQNNHVPQGRCDTQTQKFQFIGSWAKVYEAVSWLHHRHHDKRV